MEEGIDVAKWVITQSGLALTDPLVQLSRSLLERILKIAGARD